jgi:tRNA(adenine34) deaminase
VGIVRTDEYWMQLALEQAQRAATTGEVPVGAVLVDDHQQLLAAGHNQPISSHDPTAHAEIIVLRQAAQARQNYRLNGSTMYVTVEPCVMCVGAMVHARIKRLVYGAEEYKTGAIISSCQLLEDVRFNHIIEVTSGVLKQPCADILSDFFAMRRALKKSVKNQGVT